MKKEGDTFSISKIKQSLTDFLNEDDSLVVAIRGAWGIGKTHFWERFIKNLERNDNEKFLSYSYVSLFGIESISELKNSIFEHTVKRDMIGKPITIDTVSNNVEIVISSLFRKVASEAKRADILGKFDKVVSSASFLTVQNSLICIDDLERKGDKLSIKDVLGLLSQLKEQRNCKIVILLNDNEEGMSTYSKYREKIIDIEFTYNPTVAHNVQIVFGCEDKLVAICRNYCIALGSKNIRTLHKTKRYLKLISPILEGLEEEVNNQIIASIALYCLCFYRSGNESIPTIEYVLNVGYSLYRSKDKRNKEERNIFWDEFLTKYGYRETNEIDRSIASGIQSGYFDMKKITELTSEKNKEVLRHKSNQRYVDAWSLFHNSFGDDEDELIKKLEESILENIEDISPMDLNSTVLLLRDVGEGHLADSIIKTFIDKRRNNLGVFNLDKYPFSSDITDVKIKNDFMEKNKKIEEKPPLRDVIDHLTSHNGWPEIFEEILAESTPQQYVDIFESEKGGHLRDFVLAVLKFKSWSDGNDLRKKIGNNVETALKIIGNKSSLNRRRVKRFGIEVDDVH